MNQLPIEVKLEKTKKDIVDTINELSKKYSLSYYLLYYVMKEIFEIIESGKIDDIKSINTQIQDFEKNEKEVKDNEKN